MTSKFINVNFKSGLEDYDVETYDGNSALRTSAMTEQAAPTDITLSNSTIIDDAIIGDTIGTFTTTDADLPSDSHTYSIILDADSKFSVAGSSLKLAALVDSAVSASHAVTIRTTDFSGFTFDKEFTITIDPAIGPSTNSVYFNGVNGYLSLGAAPTLSFSKTDSFTFSTWAKPDAANASSTYFSKGNATTHLFIFGYQGKIYLRAFGPSQGIRIVTSTTPLSSTAWALITVSYDGSSTAAGVKVYYNGAPLTIIVNDDNLTTADFYTTATAKIGISDAFAGYAHEGYMDEYTVWDKVLTPAEVVELYNVGVTYNIQTHSAAANLITWLRMGENGIFPAITDEQGVNEATAISMVSGDITTEVP
jgi:hypothetical protein